MAREDVGLRNRGIEYAKAGPFAVPLLALAITFIGLMAAGASAAHSLRADGDGVVLTSLGGHVVAANADGSGVRALTRPPTLSKDANPVGSPDGSAVAFERDYSWIYVMRVDGHDLHRVARVAPGEFPQWAPDGRLIAYVGEDDGIYVVRPDGEGARRVASRTFGGFTWSPDGASIAYSASQGIESVDVRTGGRRLLLRNAGASGPSWSPDGTRIAFLVDGRVWVMNADGRAARRIGPLTFAETLAWSPDGTRLAYGATASRGGRMRVTVVDVSTGVVTMTVPPLVGAESGDPVWSEDGSRLAFRRGNTAGSSSDIGADVWVVRADGTDPVQITQAFPFDGAGSEPRWLPAWHALTADPLLPTVPLAGMTDIALPHTYSVGAVDGSSVVIGVDRPRRRQLGVWHDSGRVSWLGAYCAYWAEAALVGNRAYWSCNDDNLSGSKAEVWTSTWPKGRPRLLRRVTSNGLNLPRMVVAGDRSLVVYTFGGSVWRLGSAHARRIRRERTSLVPLSVNAGRVVLERGKAELEVVNGEGRLLALIHDRDLQGAVLSGDRVVVLGAADIRIYGVHGGQLRATWPVGAPGIPPRAGFIYRSLFPYTVGSALHVLDVDTGHDLIVAIPGATWPVTGAMTSSGLICTWAATYEPVIGRVGFVSLTEIRAALGKQAGKARS
jgi:hypothetical protein